MQAALSKSLARVPVSTRVSTLCHHRGVGPTRAPGPLQALQPLVGADGRRRGPAL